jgi:hypothetical protein
MTFTNRLGLITPSFGSPLANDTLYLSANNLLNGVGGQTVVMGSLSPTVKAGYVRVKVYELTGTTPNLVSVTVSFTDGTTTEYVAEIVPISGGPIAISKTVWLDVVIPFLLDINANSCTVTVYMGGTNPQCYCDVEIAPTTGTS